MMNYKIHTRWSQQEALFHQWLNKQYILTKKIIVNSYILNKMEYLQNKKNMKRLLSYKMLKNYKANTNSLPTLLHLHSNTTYKQPLHQHNHIAHNIPHFLRNYNTFYHCSCNKMYRYKINNLIPPTLFSNPPNNSNKHFHRLCSSHSCYAFGNIPYTVSKGRCNIHQLCNWYSKDLLLS